MANASSGEPLAFRHGVILYSAQSNYGSAVTPATALGFCSGTLTQHSSNASFRGPGSPNRLAVKGGSTYNEIALRMAAVSEASAVKTFLQKGARSSGVLPLITMGIGYEDDQGTSNKSAVQVQDCKIASWNLGLDASSGHGPLTADFSLTGGEATTLTSLVRTTLTDPPRMSYEAVFTRAASAYPVRSLQLSCAQTLSRDHVIAGSTPASFQRGHAYLTEHDEALTGTITRYKKSGVSIQANAISTFAQSLVFTSLTGGGSLTIALTTCDFGSEETGEDEQGVFYSVDWECTSFTIS